MQTRIRLLKNFFQNSWILIKISYISIYPQKIASFLGFTAFQTQASRISKLPSSTSLAFWRFFFSFHRASTVKSCALKIIKRESTAQSGAVYEAFYLETSPDRKHSKLLDLFNEEGLPRFKIIRKRLIKFGIFFPDYRIEAGNLI